MPPPVPPPVVLGYVDVWTGLSTTAKKLRTFPLAVFVVPAVAGGDPPPSELVLLAANSFTIDTPGQLLVGALISQNDAAGQKISFIVAPDPSLADAEVVVRVNASFFTTLTVDYTTHESPKRGESFVVVGTRFPGTSAMPMLRVNLTVAKGTGSRPNDVTTIRIGGAFDQPRELIVGQQRQRTKRATFTSTGMAYRRAFGGDFDGIRLNATLHDPATLSERWVQIEMSSPRAEDGPASAVEPTAPTLPPVVDTLDPGHGIPTSGFRQYQVTWLHDHGNETSPSPPSEAVAAPDGRLRVPLPVWTDPRDPTPTGPRVPEVPTKRRVYRTVTSKDGTSGEFFLVKEIPNANDTSFLDDRGDDQLGPPVLSEMSVRYRHTTDLAGAQLATGFASLRAVLVDSSYEETTAGDPRFRATVYDLDLSSTPPAADVHVTTRPDPGKPRLTWRSWTAMGPAGVGTARAVIVSLGPAFQVEQTIRALLQGVPPAFGVDWFSRGETQTRIEIGAIENAGTALAQGLGVAVLRVAGVDAALQAPSARSVSVDSNPDVLAGTARGLRRVRLLLGLPHPTQPLHAVIDQGVVAELVLDPRRDGRPRSLRVRADSGDAGKRSRVMLRAGELPDELKVDARINEDGSKVEGRIAGRTRRLMLLSQSAGELAGEDTSQHRRRDGAWVTIPDLGERVDFLVSRGRATLNPSDPIRADVSIRSSAGLGDSYPKLHQLQATVHAKSVDALFPEGGQTVLSIADGASGRVASSRRSLAPHVRDRLVALRATPQVKTMLRWVGTGEVDDDAAARVLGLTGLVLPPSVTDLPYRVSFSSKRANRAFRGHVLLSDVRVQASPWDLVRARIADVPESVVATLEDIGRATLVLNRRSGRVVVFAQPLAVLSSGVLADVPVGVGLATVDVDALPTNLQIDVLGGTNDMQSAPFNKTPDAGWRRSGFRIKTDGELVARAIQLIDASFVRPATMDGSKVVLPTVFWTQTAAALIRVAPESTAAPGAVWIWTPAAPFPASLVASAWEDLDAWIGYRIDSPALVTLQIQAYEANTTALSHWWNGLSWALRAELQMKDYRGEVTVHGEITPSEYLLTGDEDAGPGKWYLNIPDGSPAGGPVMFGNTGGWISSRPRIFAPFTPTYG
jgi:hypothetical protein